MTYYIDLTPSSRARIERQGYLEPLKLQLDEVETASEDWNYFPDWERVIALINRGDTQSHYNTIVLYQDQRMIKVRTTTNRMIKRLRKHFALDYHNDVRLTIAKAMRISRIVPYVCRDFWLMPMGPIISKSRSWYRWQYQSDYWDYSERGNRVVIDEHMVLQWPLSKEAIERRKSKCKEIASYLKQQAEAVSPSAEISELGHRHTVEDLDKLIAKVERAKRAMILEKVGFLEFSDQVDRELNQNKYWQIPDTEF
ncbi:hypothetical protein IWT140_00169 [Secundilactobacillus pentosiphilus]|uniref:Uncharacterized protein n=1 Tax=Secundilactobacillus pentosiphilus TaxID=1714682 RepID=A0A1Z5ILW9_9LACO|nr:hypothetical protein [Secundilactobacillus pentosiphilus]GAX02572.1 hypothetical protein IWT140_00169 [Secundilactobacillus pentosiphilus]